MVEKCVGEPAPTGDNSRAWRLCLSLRFVEQDDFRAMHGMLARHLSSGSAA